jgi:fatty acid synthase
MSCFIFCGSGCVTPKLGMTHYQQNPNITKIWNQVDEYFQSQLGHSLIHIINTNPRSIQFSSPFDSSIIELSHDDGILYCTPFEQVSILLYQCSLSLQFIEQKPPSYLTGHSLG